jgi:predicted RNA binding protein YcfA (HicA-like mRNA interferase family)
MKLPRGISGHRLVRALCRLGFYVDHQVGSHVVLRHRQESSRKVVVPAHSRQSLKPKGSLSRILKECGLTVEELQERL